MNAKWIGRLLSYRDGGHRLGAVQTIIHQKIVRQEALISRYNKKGFSAPAMITESDIGKLLLLEARHARTYWRAYGRLLPRWCSWQGRTPRGKDVANKLLDIGYHALALVIRRKCESLDIPCEIGILHIAQSAKAQPLTYDLMECFRVCMVDETLMKFLHAKKIPVAAITPSVVQDFLHDAYSVLHRSYYHRGRHACITFSYWIDLLLLEFRAAVSEGRAFRPSWTPVRHETRCNRKPPHVAEA